MAGEDRYTFRLDVATREAIADIDKLDAATEGVNDTLNETRSVAARVADVIGNAATEMADELAKAEKAADKLADAVGPEMAEKIGRARINEWVTELRKAGIAFDDIEANATNLGESLGRLENVRIDAVAQGFGKVADESDRARGVTANMAGNLAQELPGIAGQFGPVNMAISQLVEGLAEGEIGTAALTKQIGMMAGGLAAFEVLKPLVQSVIDLGKADEEAAKRAAELTASNLDASRSMDVQTVAAISATEATLLYGQALSENADRAVRDKIIADHDLLAAMAAYGIGIDEVIAATHDLTAAQVLNTRITDEALARGDAKIEQDSQLTTWATANGSALLRLTEITQQGAAATARSTEDMVNLAKAGDLLAIEYLKATSQLDRLTPAEQRQAQAVLNRAAADDRATEAARQRAAAQRDLNAANDPATSGRQGEAARGGTTNVYYPAGADPARYRDEQTAWTRRNGTS